VKIFLLAAILTLEPLQATQETAVEGRVVRAGSQDPIPNVQITLIRPIPGGVALNAETTAALDSIQQLVSGAPRGISRAYLDTLVANREQALGLPPGTFAQATSQPAVLTDAAGLFSFRNQAPGTYAVRAALDGYFGPAINGVASTTITKSVTVEAAKPTAPTDIVMVKGGVIAGRIQDLKGEPISGIDVAATRLIYSNGRPQWTTVISKATDDHGVFRLFWVPPGEYYVGAVPREAIVTPGSVGKTYYPGVTDPSAARTVVVKDASEISGIDFSLPPIVPTSTYRIRGIATNPLAVPNAAGDLDRNANSFMLVLRDPGNPDIGTPNPPTLQNSLPPQARLNGEFEIQNVRAGSYDLFIYYSLPATLQMRRYYIDRTRVEVRDKDVDGVSLQIQNGTEIRGKVVQQGAATLPMDKVKVSLRSQDTMPEAFATIVGAISVGADGSFSAPNIPSARYALQVTGLPETAYVADIRKGGTNVFNAGFTVDSQPTTTLEIIVNANGGTIEGSVQTPDRRPAENTTVVLVPTAADRQNAMKYKFTETDNKGSYSVKGVAPGEYTLFAWENVPLTAWMNADFLAKYQNRGRPVVVSQSSRINVQLDQIADDAKPR